MSMLYVLAKDISPQSYKKAIRLRLIRTYIVTEGRNKSAVKSQECVFHDIESPMVVSTIRDLYERAESKMQVPVEFEQMRNKSMVFRINLKNEHIRNPAKPISVLSESESGDEAISPIVQANLKLKGVANDQDEVDTGAIKRCLLDQFSSSQNLKKCRPLVIKEEKTL
nr:replication protein A 70 kDa DNA-binding subunit B-like [Ipomoea batatas]